MEKIQEIEQIAPYNFFLSWLVTPLYISLFFFILVIYHPFLVISNKVSYRAFSRILLSMCNSLIRNLSWVAGVKFTFYPNANTPANIPILVISNHQSMYDIPMLIHILYNHDPRFISKKELGRWLPSISFTLRNTHSALIDRKDRRQSVAAIKEAAQLAYRDNAALSIFPEGTRARDGVIKKFKTAGFLSILEEIPNVMIVPIAISRSWELLRYKLLPIPYGIPVSVSVLDPINPVGKDPLILLESIENDIRKEVLRLDSLSHRR